MSVVFEEEPWNADDAWVAAQVHLQQALVEQQLGLEAEAAGSRQAALELVSWKEWGNGGQLLRRRTGQLWQEMLRTNAAGRLQ